MSVERTCFIRLPTELGARVQELSALASACLARAAKLDPGDRTEALRFEGIHAVIDQLSIAALNAGAQAAWSSDTLATGCEAIVSSDAQLPAKVATWVRSGAVVTRLRLPHGFGETHQGGELGRGPSPPAARWQAKEARRAGEERFDALLAAALDGVDAERAVIRPSDVSNSVLTESLRRAALAEPGRPPVELPVIYRDGSNGPKFPLRQLKMSDVTPPSNWRTLRFTLMSIRHVEMDALVDGAWFRNSKISRPRPAGLTDELAFEISKRQLREACSSGPVVIHMFQTGLEPAVMGFYRAVVVFLMATPGTVAVVPHYYQGESNFSQGSVWRTA
jgi:hypothetical protein